jgi:hypothetical protein
MGLLIADCGFQIANWGWSVAIGFGLRGGVVAKGKPGVERRSEFGVSTFGRTQPGAAVPHKEVMQWLYYMGRRGNGRGRRRRSGTGGCWGIC